MAEVVGLAASIIQIAGAGAKLSVALYNFTDSAARADQDIKDIADDVELTSNALESVGKVFESEDAKSIVSKKAIQDANNIIKKCQGVFNEVSEMVEKRRKIGKDGKKALSVMGKLAWPMKEQRVELNRRRLESLKNSLVLLLHVLQLAQGQSRGKMEKSVMEEERDKIRELHQRQQDSLKSLQALESRFCDVALDDDEALQGSSIASRVPTLELMTNTQTMKLPPLEKHSKSTANTITIDLSGADDSETSDSDATMTDEDEEHISIEELSRAAKHVTKLLKRITVLQTSLDKNQKPHRKRRVHKMYQRFCRKFESGINVAQAAGPPTYRSPVAHPLKQHRHAFDLNVTGGEALENFDFDSFVHVQPESTPFSVVGWEDFGLPASQQISQQALISPEPSCSHSSDTPTGRVSQIPPVATHAHQLESHQQYSKPPYFTNMPMPVSMSGPRSPAPDSQIFRQWRPILLPAPQASTNEQPRPESSPSASIQAVPSMNFVPSLASVNMPSLSYQQSQMQQQQQQQLLLLLHQEQLKIQQSQAQIQAQMQRQATIQAHSQFTPSPAMPMLNRPMRPRVNESHPAMPNRALQDYQDQLMVLEQQNKKRLLASRREQDDESQPSANSMRPIGSGEDATTNLLDPTFASRNWMKTRSLSSSEDGCVDVSIDHGQRNSYNYSDSSAIVFNPAQSLHMRTGTGSGSNSSNLDRSDVPRSIPSSENLEEKQLPKYSPQSETDQTAVVSSNILQRFLRNPVAISGPSVSSEEVILLQKILAVMDPANKKELLRLPEPQFRERLETLLQHIKPIQMRQSAPSSNSRAGDPREALKRRRTRTAYSVEQKNQAKKRRKLEHESLEPIVGKGNAQKRSRPTEMDAARRGNSYLQEAPQMLKDVIDEEQPAEIDDALDSSDRDVVDVLLEQWTVPVY